MASVNREQVAGELAEVLDRIDAEEERLKEHNRRAKERIAGLRDRARNLRDVIAGRSGVQLPMAVTVLDEARRVAKRKGAEDGRPEE